MMEFVLAACHHIWGYITDGKPDWEDEHGNDIVSLS